MKAVYNSGIVFFGNTHSQIVYAPLGRMTSKQADGQTVFANAGFASAAGQPARPHAMKSAETVPNVFPAASQTVTYTGFDKVKVISEGGNTLEYTYGYDQQRISMVETVGSSIRNKEYVGPCEYIDENNGGEKTSKTLTYLVGPYGVLAVVEQQDNEESMHYILKDHLGSWTTITDSEGNVEQELSFDAWGNLRNPATWSGSYSGTPMFDRGYTGHEHMTTFGLINMNGRCYDPLTSSFLSVDAYVQDPTCAQAFNRYAYCAHNPLRYTDPTGWYQYSGNYGINPNMNPGTHTTYHSDDPNDMLWGRTSHPWANSSSGYVNGVSYTTTRYTEGTQLPKIVFASKKEEEEYNAFRDEVFKYDTEEYKEIQEELLLLESAIEVFCIRMGENITSKAGGGNFRYNIETDEFDLNISDYGDYDSKGKIAHECKHGFQYLNRELGFDLLTGEKIAYDRNDEHEAFERQRMFGKTLSKDKVNERYNYLLDLKSNRTIDNLPKFQEMKRMNKQYQEHNSVRFLYHGWQNDIR